MTASIDSSPVHRERGLLGQTVVVIGGSSGIGLETARLARANGADIILTARNPDRLHRAGLELEASIAAFDATDFARLGRFFDALPAPINHLLVTGPGLCHPPPAGSCLDAARRDLDAHLLLPLQIARHTAGKIRPAGTLLFIGSTGGRRAAAGPALIAAITAALPARRPRPRRQATGSTSAASNSAPRCRSAASSARPTSPHWPSTSWPTPRSPARPSTSTAASSSSKDKPGSP